MKALTARLAASGRARPLCFQTKNADVSVLLDGEEVYRFTSRENLTGKGYGTAFHYVGLSSADAGRTVRICLRGVLDGCEGRVWRTHLCPSVRYVQMYTAEKVLSFRLSLLIAFFGFLLFTFYLFMPDKAAMPFDAAALGAAVLAFGLWSMIDTGMPPSSATASSSARCNIPPPPESRRKASARCSNTSAPSCTRSAPTYLKIRATASGTAPTSGLRREWRRGNRSCSTCPTRG